MTSMMISVYIYIYIPDTGTCLSFASDMSLTYTSKLFCQCQFKLQVFLINLSTLSKIVSFSCPGFSWGQHKKKKKATKLGNKLIMFEIAKTNNWRRSVSNVLWRPGENSSRQVRLIYTCTLRDTGLILSHWFNQLQSSGDAARDVLGCKLTYHT